MVGPEDVQHAARCASAWHFHQADPYHGRTDPGAAQRRIGALMSRVRSQQDPVAHLWLPLMVVIATGAVALAHFLFQDRSVAGYIIIATALVLLQCGAALLTLQWAEAKHEQRFREAMGPIPPELGGDLPPAVGPVKDRKWGLSGPVGDVVHVSGRTIPIVVAPGKGHHGVEPWMALRAGASLRLLEVRDGTAPEYGLVAYDDGVYRVPYEDVRGPLQVLVDGLRRGNPPKERDHADRHRCITCPWRMGCTHSLA